MAELMDHVRVLADQIGPRPVSTEEEHQTSLYVAQELTDSGFEVNVDEFATPTGTRWAYALAFVAVALGTVISGIGVFVPGIALSMFVVGIVLVAAGVFVYYTELNHNPFLSKLRAGGVSQNVVAKHVPASVARDTRSRKVVVVAHVDTVRAQPEAMPQLVQHAPLLRKILYYDMIALAAIVVVRALPLPWPDAIDLVLWIVSLIGGLYALAAAGCIVANRFMPYISGANDNASAVAVMLTVAKRLLDPDERAKAAERRAAKAKAAAEELDAKLAAEDAQVEVHDAQAAAEAGVVPEGATIEYDEASSQQTTVLPPIDPETGLPAVDASAPAADSSSAETQIDAARARAGRGFGVGRGGRARSGGRRRCCRIRFRRGRALDLPTAFRRPVCQDVRRRGPVQRRPHPDQAGRRDSARRARADCPAASCGARPR